MGDVCVATGCFHDLDMEITDVLAAVADAGADGVEVTLGTAEEAWTLDVDMVRDALAEHGMAAVSVHAPFRTEFDYSPESRALLDRVEDIRTGLDAAVAVFHPDRLAAVELARAHTTPAIENMQKRKGFGRDDFARFVDDEVAVVLDTCHAATWGDGELAALAEEYRDRVAHLHVSGYDAETGEEHVAVADHGLPDGAGPLLDGTLVIETRLGSAADLDRELAAVRALR